MKKGPTLLLKGVIVLAALAVLAFCLFGLPLITTSIAIEFPPVAPLRDAMLFGLWLTAIPFFFGLSQGFRLLTLIDRGTAFSEDAVNALRHIKQAAFAMTGLYLIGMPIAFLIAQYDDAPGLIIMALALACSPSIVAIFAGVLEKLFRHAIELKSENDLIV